MPLAKGIVHFKHNDFELPLVFRFRVAKIDAERIDAMKSHVAGHRDHVDAV